MALRDSPATAWYQFNGNPISVSHSCYDGYSRDKEETDSVETRQETAGRHNTAKRGNPTQDLTDSFQISFGMEFKHNGVEFIHVASPPVLKMRSASATVENLLRERRYCRWVWPVAYSKFSALDAAACISMSVREKNNRGALIFLLFQLYYMQPSIARNIF